MKEEIPRVVFAAPKSGSGKTMITCGMIAALKRKGMRVISFKCGPDYIDPMFHQKALGVPAANLDTFFTGEEGTCQLLRERAQEADIALLEGVMGYYDGLAGQSDQASTYEVAKVTKSPVILVVDGKGASVSLSAMVKGMIQYRTDSRIRGILLNRVSEGYYQRLKELLERECGIPVVGFLPELPELAVPSRHLGLIAPEEMEDFRSWAGRIADCMEQTVEIEEILKIARTGEKLTGRRWDFKKLPRPVKIAVARDEAFSFYYAENLELLEKMGAEILYFSPLHDRQIPEEADGLILGGGYPENFAKELEQNERMRKSVKAACETEMPTLAECGGFLYLQKEIKTKSGSRHEMAGVLEGSAWHTGRLCRFGYFTAQTKRGSVLGERAGLLKAHEFHYYDCTENGSGMQMQKPLSGQRFSEVVCTKSMVAGFPHFYYYSNPDMLYQFLTNCLSYQAGRLAKKHWDEVAKPIDSLGLLEEMVGKLCRIQKKAVPYDLSRRALVILCGDHGVVKEGVTQTGSEVTRIVSENFAKGCSTVNYMAQRAKADIYAVDIGMDTPCYPQKELKTGGVTDRKIARGCGNIAVEPAMDLEQCRRALDTGKRLAWELKQKGYGILAVGEMGIGNTTPTSALAAAFFKQPAEAVTGKGAGLSREGLEKKCRVVEQAAERVRAKGLTEPEEILAEIGSLEIAGMAGVFLGGALYEIPVVIDGAVSAMAAFVASRIDPRAVSYMLPSHQSEEITGRLALSALSLEAPVHAHMCLGEGTGAITLLPMLDMAMEVYRNMGTFGEYQIDAYQRFQ